MSASAVETKLQACRQAVAQLQEMLRMDFSADLCPMVDILVNEARDEVGQLQQAGEACIAEGRFDLVEQLTGIASELDDVQRRAEVWKSGRSPAGGGGGGGLGAVGGGGAGPSGGGSHHMSDDERMARELAAQFEEEERIASNQGTPAQSHRSHRSAQEEDDERLARELAAAEGHSAPVLEAPSAAGPPRGEEGVSPVLSSAALGGPAVPVPGAADRASDGGSDTGRGVVRKKEKKKKKEKEEAWGGDSFGGGDNFGGASDGGGFGGGWPGGGATTDTGAAAAPAGFQADFGAFGGGAGWADSNPSAFPQAGSAVQAFGEEAPPAQDFGAFGSSSAGGFAVDAKPSASAFASEPSAFPAAPDSAPALGNPFGGGGSPGAEFGNFRDIAGGDALSAPPGSPPQPAKVASQDSWGSSGTGKHGWGSQPAGETLTMHIRRPFSEIADDVEGFTSVFVRDIARAMGISEQRIRVQAVRPS